MAKTRKRRATPSRTAQAGAAHAAAVTDGARTMIFVHGIGNKPIQSVLKCQWDNALFDFDLGERSRLAYWVNRESYPDPTADTCQSGDTVKLEDQPTGRGLSIRSHLEAVTLNDEVAARDRQRAAAAPPPVHRAQDADERRRAEGPRGRGPRRRCQGPPVRRAARLRHPVLDARVSPRRQRLLLRPGAPRGDAPQRARADRSGRRPLRGDRAQPGLDGRVRRPAEPPGRRGRAPVRDDRLPARHHRGAGPGQAPDQPAEPRGARLRPGMGERRRSAGPGRARQGPQQRLRAVVAHPQRPAREPGQPAQSPLGHRVSPDPAGPGRGPRRGLDRPVPAGRRLRHHARSGPEPRELPPGGAAPGPDRAPPRSRPRPPGPARTWRRSGRP